MEKNAFCDKKVLFSNSLWEYIDRENGTCNFTSNEFRQVLELCYKSNREKVESYQEAQVYKENGKHAHSRQ